MINGDLVNLGGGGLPPVTSSDEGKIYMVSDVGTWDLTKPIQTITVPSEQVTTLQAALSGFLTTALANPGSAVYYKYTTAGISNILNYIYISFLPSR